MSAMALWQLDIIGGAVPGRRDRSAKVVTGVDDHSRYLRDRHRGGRGRPEERCAWRSPPRCASSGFPARSSPTTASSSPSGSARPAGRGAVRPDLPGERHHPPADQAPLADDDGEDRAVAPDLQQELLNVHGPFADIGDAQAAVERGAGVQRRPAASVPRDGLSRRTGSRRPPRTRESAGYAVFDLVRCSRDGPDSSLRTETCPPWPRPQATQPVPGGREAGPVCAPAAEPVAGRPADLAGASDDRPHRRLGPVWTEGTYCWTATGSRPGRHGWTPATWPAWRRPGRCPPGRVAAAACGIRRRDRGRADRERLGQRQPRRSA